MVPPGIRIVAHEAVYQHLFWVPNGEDGWSIGPAVEYYRCMLAYFPKTTSERNVKTIAFSPHVIPFPKVTTNE